MTLQVDNFQKVYFVYHFFEEFDQKLYIKILLSRIIFKTFNKMSNKTDVQKIINL